jgi:hypothetical protein
LLDGRRVAVVGPSASIVGTRQGQAIESRDLVVRINHQWPVPEALTPDVGARMDILYHCCNGDRPVSRLFVPAFHQTKFVCFEQGVDHARLVAECRQSGIETLDVTDHYLQWLGRLHSYPNTGFAAITHLLEHGVTELFVAGFTFFRDAYYDGYPGSGNRPERWQNGAYPRRTWWHDADRQLDAFRDLAARNSRVVMDARLRQIVDEAQAR